VSTKENTRKCKEDNSAPASGQALISAVTQPAIDDLTTNDPIAREAYLDYAMLSLS